MPVLEAVKSKKWGAGSPTVVTYIHRLSSPPGLVPDQSSGHSKLLLLQLIHVQMVGSLPHVWQRRYMYRGIIIGYCVNILSFHHLGAG